MPTHSPIELLPTTTHIVVCKTVRGGEWGAERYLETQVYECCSLAQAQRFHNIVAIFPKEANLITTNLIHAQQHATNG